MVTGEQTEGTPQVEPVAQEQPKVEPALTPEAIKAMIAQEVEKAKQEGYKQSQRVIAKKDQRIKELETKATAVPDNLSEMEMMFKAMQSGDEGAIKNAEAMLAQAKIKRERDAQLQRQQQLVESNRSNYEKQIEEAGLDPDNPQLDTFWDAFETAKNLTGDFSIAERRLTRTINSIKKETPQSKPEEKKSTFDEAKYKEELERQILEKHGLLHSDAGVPSAAMKKRDEGYAKFARGEINADEAFKQYGITPN